MNATQEPSSPVELAAALDELIDEISEVKQAGWLTAGHPLHAAFSELFSFLVASVQAIVQHEEDIGGNRLAIRTPTGRVGAKLTARAPGDIVDVVTRHLALLAEEIGLHATALTASDPASSTLLEGIVEGLDDQQQLLRAAAEGAGTT